MIVITIYVVLSVVALVSTAAAWRSESRVKVLHRRQESDHKKLVELDERFDSLKTNFMKVLKPIRQNAEDIDQLDDDLARIQRLVEELKKGEAQPPPPLPEAA
jgi:septal ring factor EnvC (AmiA/AmiB activator)